METNNTKDTKDTFGVWLTAGDYKKKKETVHRTKLATEDKTTKRWCRNCLQQVKLSDAQCPQCGVTNRQPLKSKPRGV